MFQQHEANVTWLRLVHGPLCRTVVVVIMSSHTFVCEAVQRIILQEMWRSDWSGWVQEIAKGV